MSNQTTLGNIEKPDKANQTEETRETIRGEKIPADWEKTSIGKVSKEMADGGTPDRTDENGFFGGDINWVIIGDIQFEIENTKEKLTEEGLKDSSATLWPEGSVIVSTGASIGEVGLAKKPTATKQGITGIIPKDKITPHFLARYLQYKSDLLDARAQGSTFQEIRPYLLKELKMPLPSKPEQRQIASVLYRVDQAIQKTEEIIEQTQRVKKGLMQELFTEGVAEKKENKRIKIGPNEHLIPKNWDLRKLGELIKIQSGNSFKSKNYTEKGAPLIRISNIQGGYLDLEDLEHLPYEYLERYDTYTLSQGDIVLVMTRPIIHAGIKAARIDWDKRFLLNQRTVRINSSQPTLLSDDFLYHYLFSNVFVKQVKISVRATHQPNLSKKDLKSFKIPLPPLAEQKKTLKILNSIDSQKEYLKTEKEHLQRAKKGLMQDLLTGKVRTAEDVEVIEEVVEYE